MCSFHQHPKRSSNSIPLPTSPSPPAYHPLTQPRSQLTLSKTVLHLIRTHTYTKSSPITPSFSPTHSLHQQQPHHQALSLYHFHPPPGLSPATTHISASFCHSEYQSPHQVHHLHPLHHFLILLQSFYQLHLTHQVG